MPPNDIVSLNLLYDDWCKSRLTNGKAPGGIQPFEYFCAEQFLKPHLLNDDELVRGLIGDKDDGGIDAFHFFIDRVLADADTKVDHRGEYDVHVVIMQIRENRGFSPTALEKMDRFTDDLLDLQRTSDSTPKRYRYGYHPKLQELMRVFKQKMLGMSRASLTLEYYFVTRCDEEHNENCARVAEQIKATVNSYFDKAVMHPFNYAGAQRLYQQAILRSPAKKHLTFIKSFDTPEGWIGLVSLPTFYEFLKDDESPLELNETIFDDNVRGYYHNTPINRAISDTLTNAADEPEFWLLNNGITILTPSTQLKSGVLEIKDPQIVNGLQTSRRIFDYYKSGAAIPDDDPRRILIRVIENQDPEIRDEIIRATNNQNKMPPEALISTGRLHRQLDRFFADNGLFYDRRKGYYKDQGKEIGKIVSILELVQAVVAIVLKKPSDARGRPRDYVAKDQKRWNVFGPDDYRPPEQLPLMPSEAPFDLRVYLNSVLIQRRVDEFLRGQRLDNTQFRNLRFYVGRYASAALANNAHCPLKELAEADISRLTDEELKKYLNAVEVIYVRHHANDDAAKGKPMQADVDAALVAAYSPRNSAIGKSKRIRRSHAKQGI